MIVGLIAGFIIGSVITNYLKSRDINFKYKNIIISLIIIWLVYSLIGIVTANEFKKKNGNVCQGYKYGLKICGGDVNAE